jgi:hypothetical protein
VDFNSIDEKISIGIHPGVIKASPTSGTKEESIRIWMEFNACRRKKCIPAIDISS